MFVDGEIGWFSLVELELDTLDESLLGDGVSVLGLSFWPSASASVRPTPASSQPFRFPKVMRAFRM